MKFNKITHALLVLAALSATAASGQAVGVTDKEVRIGEVVPLTGAVSFAGEAHFLGSKLAAAGANDSGGVGGRKVVVVTEDDGYVPARAFQAAQKLVTSDKVFAITGTSGTSHTNAMMPMLIENNVPTIVSINPNEQSYTPPKKQMFVLGVDYATGTYELTKGIAQRLGKKGGKYVVIYQDDDYGANIRQGYRRVVKDLGLDSVAEVEYKRGQRDFAAEMLKIAALKPDVIISENVAIMREARKLGLPATIGTVWTAHLPVVQNLAGEAGEGYITVDYTATPSDASAKDFMALARKHLSPDEIKKLNRYSMTAYAGMTLMVQAMRLCEKTLTRDCVISQLESGKGFDVGPFMDKISFTADRRLSGAKLRFFRSDAKAADFVPID